jgi:hypothetical protein
MIRFDYLNPNLTPKQVCNYLRINGNYLGHEVKVTIGFPSRSPEKRGQSAGYSPRDVILIEMGRRLIAMGITPHRVKSCIQAVLQKWGDVENADFFYDEGYLVGGPDMHLLAEDLPKEEFSARVLTKDDFLFLLDRGRRFCYPRIIYDIGGLVHAVTIDLVAKGMISERE